MSSEFFLGGFLAVAVLVVLAVDLGVFQKEAHALSMKRAIGWSIFWIAFAFAFNVVVWYWVGNTEAVQFLSGYLVEKSLSTDNLFVFLLIFSYFHVPVAYQHKVLFWGIVGAIVMRGVLIWAGIQLIQTYHWLTYLLGAFLVYTGFKTLVKNDDNLELEKKPLLRLLRRFLPLTEQYEGDRFLVYKAGRWYATPLLVVLLMIETTDILFALDSIPAILAITTDPFVLYSSNLFAILGLRALYFVLAGLMQTLHYLRHGVSLILVFVGTSMIISPWYKVSDWTTLGVICVLLAFSVVSSWMYPPVPGQQQNFEP